VNISSIYLFVRPAMEQTMAGRMYSDIIRGAGKTNMAYNESPLSRGVASPKTGGLNGELNPPPLSIGATPLLAALRAKVGSRWHHTSI